MTEKVGKSALEKAWDLYTATLEPVQICADVLGRVVKAVTALPPELRGAMHTTYEASREAYNQALDAESKAHERYKTAAHQPDLFDQAGKPVNGQAEVPGPTPPATRRKAASSRPKPPKSSRRKPPADPPAEQPPAT
jgi:hypothetical protein